MAKKERVSIDFITTDPVNDEYVLYLVEEGPWNEEVFVDRLREVQSRIYKTIDVAIDGHLAKTHPESRGRKIRIQVDLHDNPSVAVDELVGRLASHVAGSVQHQRDIEASDSIAALRITSKRL
jgi:hypothetical protein